MEVKLISITKPVKTDITAEALIAYCARVSSPHQTNPQYAKLLRYCIDKGHWSIFEMAHMCVEITTTRMIAAQLLRHKSFSFQEYSQRYANALGYEPCEARRQDEKNRQNSIDDLPKSIKEQFLLDQQKIWEMCEAYYQNAIEQGIAKECARSVLPLNTKTQLYMNGSVRSWIHYLGVRTDESTQLEHRVIAERIKDIFTEQFPVIAEAAFSQDSESSGSSPLS